MSCPYCGARETHNGDAYHCGTRVDGQQSKQCKRDSGDVTPYQYVPVNSVFSAGLSDSHQHEEAADILNDVLSCKGKVPTRLRERIKQFLGEE